MGTRIRNSTSRTGRVEDEELQNFVDSIEEAPSTPDGFLPHQCSEQDVKYPNLTIADEKPGQDLSDFQDPQVDLDFLERVGNNVAAEIIKDARQNGRRANPR